MSLERHVRLEDPTRSLQCLHHPKSWIAGFSRQVETNVRVDWGQVVTLLDAGYSRGAEHLGCRLLHYVKTGQSTVGRNLEQEN